jgi:hypothetical protein
MQEAKYSFNIRFNLSGYDCQFTVRSEDEPGIDTLKKVPSILAELEKLGATSERRWEKVKNGNGNGHDKEEKAQPKGKSDNDSPGGPQQGTLAPVRGYYFPDAKGTTGVVGELPQEVCPHCGVVGQVEVIGFKRGNSYKQAPKCQACEKWLPEDK